MQKMPIFFLYHVCCIISFCDIDIEIMQKRPIGNEVPLILKLIFLKPSKICYEKAKASELATILDKLVVKRTHYKCANRKLVEKICMLTDLISFHIKNNYSRYHLLFSASLFYKVYLGREIIQWLVAFSFFFF